MEGGVGGGGHAVEGFGVVVDYQEGVRLGERDEGERAGWRLGGEGGCWVGGGGRHGGLWCRFGGSGMGLASRKRMKE